MFATLFWAPTGSCPLFFVSVFSTHIPYTLYQNALGPFGGPRDYCPLFPNSPSPAAYPYIFSAVSTFFSLPFSRYWTSWWLLNLLIIGGQSPGLLDFTNIAQSNIPISTTAPTHHIRIFNTHLLYSKKKFWKIFWALFRGPRGSCPLFSNSPSPATYPIFSDVSASFLTSFFTVVPKGLTAGSKVHVAVKLDLSILFPKNFFQNFFGPFPSTWGAFALHFRIPLLTLLIPIFFPQFRPFLHFLLQGIHLLMIGTYLLLTGWPTYGPSPLHGQNSLLHPQLHLHRLPFTMKRWSLTSTVTPMPRA